MCLHASRSGVANGHPSMERSARLARIGLWPGAFRDTSAEGQQYHLANMKALQQALAQEEGTHGRSVDVTRMRGRCPFARPTEFIRAVSPGTRFKIRAKKGLASLQALDCVVAGACNRTRLRVK